MLRSIWVEKRETANRVRGRIETIIAKNVDVDDSDFRNPAELTKRLREKLSRRPKRVVRHHPALCTHPEFRRLPESDLSIAVEDKVQRGFDRAEIHDMMRRTSDPSVRSFARVGSLCWWTAT